MSLDSSVDSYRPSPLVLGLALFSMFFGSGNLIFPLFLGQLAQEQWLTAFCGFLFTAVGLPLLGVVAMVLYAGDYRNFFLLIGRPLGFLLTALLLTVWIPLGSAPRCIALSYASLNTYFAVGPMWLYGLIYSVIVLVIILQGMRMLTILGSYLTPVLLLCLAAIVICSWTVESGVAGVSALTSPELLLRGTVEGYNTMDLIASFFFSASIIGLFRRNDAPVADTLKLVLKSGTIAAVILAVVYISLLYTAASHHSVLMEIPKEQMLAHLAKVFLGERLGIVAAIAILLACLTTSVALITVFAEFLADTLSGGRGAIYGVSLVVTSLLSEAMAMTGLEGITAVTSPLLQICYPLLLFLILYGITVRILGYRGAKELEAIPS